MKPGQCASRREVISMLAASGGVALGVNRPGAARADEAIRVGTLKVTHWAASWLIPEFAGGVQIELVEFKTSLEVISALVAGSLDVAALGYWHLIRMLDQGADVQAVSGLSSGGSGLLVRKGVSISRWEDLKGKTCAVSRGSTQDIQFQMALRRHGLKLSDVNYRDLGGNLAVHISALQQGQVDVAALWEPFTSRAIQEGVADLFSTLYDDSFRINGLIAVSSAYSAAHPDRVQSVVSALVKATDQLNGHSDNLLALSIKLSGFSADTLKMANANSTLEYILRREETEALAAGVQQIGYVKSNVTEKLAVALNYRYLTAATGKPANELGS